MHGLSAIFVTSCFVASPRFIRADKKQPCPFMRALSGETATNSNASDPFPAVPDSTIEKSCFCKVDSECRASISDGYKKDWCNVDHNDTNRCGKSSLSGYWEYCSYPENEAWEKQSFSEKQEYLLSKISENADKYKIPEYPNVLKLLTESVTTSFDNQWDAMPRGRVKFIHSVGVVCPFEIDILPGKQGETEYTGLFAPRASGTKTVGIMRLGNAVAVKGGVVPGVGIKFVRSKVKSGNFVALYDLNGTPGNYDFFSKPLSNHIAPATGATAVLAEKFKQASDFPFKVGLSDLAKYDQDGNKFQQVQTFPYKVILTPTEKFHFPSGKEIDHEELIRQLETIGANEQVYHLDAVADQDNLEVRRLGTMTTTGPCRRSPYGDEELFFRHQRVEEDYVLRPDFNKGESMGESIEGSNDDTIYA